MADNIAQVELLPVEQADRDEAAALWVWLRSEHPRPDLTAADIARIEQEYRVGKWDHDYTTQAFARRRLTVVDGLRTSIMDGLWPILGGNHNDASVWQEISAAIGAALANTPKQSARLVEPVVVRLVVAARELVFSDHRPHGAPETQAEVELIDLFTELDQATEAFAEVVAWDEQPDDTVSSLEGDRA